MFTQNPSYNPTRTNSEAPCSNPPACILCPWPLSPLSSLRWRTWCSSGRRSRTPSVLVGRAASLRRARGKSPGNARLRRGSRTCPRSGAPMARRAVTREASASAEGSSLTSHDSLPKKYCDSNGSNLPADSFLRDGRRIQKYEYPTRLEM